MCHCILPVLFEIFRITCMHFSNEKSCWKFPVAVGGLIFIGMYTKFSGTFRIVFKISCHILHYVLRPVRNKFFIVVHLSKWMLSDFCFIFCRNSHNRCVFFVPNIWQYVFHFLSPFYLHFLQSTFLELISLPLLIIPSIKKYFPHISNLFWPFP